MKTLLKHTPKKVVLDILGGIAVRGGVATVSDHDYYLACPISDDIADGIYSPIAFDNAALCKKTDLDLNRFPSTPETKTDDVTLILPRKWMLEALELLAQGMGNTEKRYYLKGVYIHNNKMVATNGHILHVVDLPKGVSVPDDKGIIIPDYAVRIMVDILKEEKKGDNCTLTIGNKITFLCGKYTLVSRTIDGDFPDYQRVIPDTTGYLSTPYEAATVKAHKKNVMAVIKQLGNKMEYSLIKLEGNNLIVGDHSFNISPCDFKTTYGFNFNYLLQLPDCDIKYGKNNHNPIHCTHALGISVVMPMRI